MEDESSRIARRPCRNPYWESLASLHLVDSCSLSPPILTERARAFLPIITGTSPVTKKKATANTGAKRTKKTTTTKASKPVGVTKKKTLAAKKTSVATKVGQSGCTIPHSLTRYAGEESRQEGGRRNTRPMPLRRVSDASIITPMLTSCPIRSHRPDDVESSEEPITPPKAKQRKSKMSDHEGLLRR
jgi:hypothetical protein